MSVQTPETPVEVGVAAEVPVLATHRAPRRAWARVSVTLIGVFRRSFQHLRSVTLGDVGSYWSDAPPRLEGLIVYAWEGAWASGNARGWRRLALGYCLTVALPVSLAGYLATRTVQSLAGVADRRVEPTVEAPPGVLEFHRPMVWLFRAAAHIPPPPALSVLVNRSTDFEAGAGRFAGYAATVLSAALYVPVWVLQRPGRLLAAALLAAVYTLT